MLINLCSELCLSTGTWRCRIGIRKNFWWREFGAALLSAHSCWKTEWGRTQRVRGLQNNTGHSDFEQNVVNLPVETLQERNESPESLTAGYRHHPALREETSSLHCAVACNHHICNWGQASCQERASRRDDWSQAKKLRRLAKTLL